jgi:hypothetical protein
MGQPCPRRAVVQVFGEMLSEGLTVGRRAGQRPPGNRSGLASLPRRPGSRRWDAPTGFLCRSRACC